MSIPYIPLYVADYEADTAHLTLEEDGAYNRLLRLCWRTAGCSIPADRKWIMRKMRVSADEYDRVVEPILEEFFTLGMGRWFNARLQYEMERVTERSEARSAAGRRGAAKRWQKTKPLKNKDTGDGKANADAMANRWHPEPEPEPKEDTNVSSTRKRKSRISETAEITDAMMRYAYERGHSQQEAKAQFERFKNNALAKGLTYVSWDRAFVTWLDSPYFKPITAGEKPHGKDGQAAARAQRIGEWYASRSLDSGEGGNSSVPLLSARQPGRGS